MKNKNVPFSKSYNIKDYKLSQTDNLVYATLHLYRNNKTYKCNPTMKQLADKINVSLDTIKNSIDKLEKLGFIKIEQNKRGNIINNIYYLPNIDNYTKIPASFIENNKYNAKLKGYAISFRNLCFTDSLQCKYTNKQIADKLNITEKTSNKYIKEMITTNIISYVNNTYILNDNTINWRLDKLEKDVLEIKENIITNNNEIDNLKKELEYLRYKDTERENEIKRLKCMYFNKKDKQIGRAHV